MLARQRQERILDQVRLSGGARVSDLVELLDVSDMTIRRDIAALAERGLVTRVHGGAVAVTGSSAEEPGFAAKSGWQTTEKASIALAAAALVSPGESVAVSGGTTSHAVALELRRVPDLTVVTNSVPVAEALHLTERDDLTVILTGGVRTPSDALVGPVAVTALSTLHVDWLMLGVHGIDEHAGLTTPNLVEAETNRALISSARRVVVVADSSKWGVVGLSSIARLDDVDVLVTDGGLDAEAQRVLRSRVGRLVVAGPVPGGSSPPHPPSGSPQRAPGGGPGTTPDGVDGAADTDGTGQVAQ
ncbi:MAG: DeoR/GlpR transcriptional regulator [Actinomycetales bacterium]|nr:DeoR/GlpR transcriptional regulator [Actinomycetales bacterium]